MAEDLFEVNFGWEDASIWVFLLCCDDPIDETFDDPSKDASSEFGFVESGIDRGVGAAEDVALVVGESVFFDYVSFLIYCVLTYFVQGGEEDARDSSDLGECEWKHVAMGYFVGYHGA